MRKQVGLTVSGFAALAMSMGAGVPAASAQDSLQGTPSQPNTINNAAYIPDSGKSGIVELTDAGEKAKINNSEKIVVSLGDSYISGEGGRWAGNVPTGWTAGRIDALTATAYNDNGKAEAIPGCHRSGSAEINFSAPGVTSVNLSCSGGETASFVDPDDGLWKPGIDEVEYKFANGVKGYGQTRLLSNLRQANPGRVRMVVLSIGGNDFDFGPIVEDCAMAFMGGDDPCSKDKAITGKFSEANIKTHRGDITNAIGRVISAMGDNGGQPWTLLVQNYPSPVAPSEYNRYGQTYRERYYLGGCPMYNKDLNWADGTALTTIDQTVFEAVADAKTANPKADIQVMDLQSALVGHRLCEKNLTPVGPWDGWVHDWKETGAVDRSEWVQAIHTFAPFEKQESMHPDYWAQKAYQNCLTQAYNGGTAVKSGSCILNGTGLDKNGRPPMLLALLTDYWLYPNVTPDMKPQPGHPGKVLNVRAKTHKGKMTAKVRWNKPKAGNPALQYFYRLKDKSGKWGPWNSLGNSRSVVLSRIQSGKYVFAVRAQNENGNGPVVKKIIKHGKKN